MTQPSFQMSVDGRALAQRLRETSVGDIVKYETLTAVIGRDVCSESRSALATARRLVMREHRMVFDAIKGEGLQRLADSQIVGLADKTRAHIRRTVRKTARALTCVDYDAMPKADQVKHNAALSLFGVMAELSTEKATVRLSHAVESAGTEIPAAKSAIAALGSIV